ncbi:TonB-dependent receptor [Tellurirhabdus rosea]|uniref:TonB-dependent receptor n=1 Tax=Tellurirhabdus rosea TaxID=2674997 RepID=UPI00224C9AB4|nr:carboxypeptidase regulatory-like domain-containing protein [Tellurirhabdus rosea]
MSKKLLWLHVVLLLSGCFGLSPNHALAQGVTTSSINGVVTDTKNEPLPGATVIAIHTPSGTRYGTTTNPQGRFSLPAVRIGGPYRITVTFIGFQEQSREIVSAELNTPVVADFRLAEEGQELTEVVITSQRGGVIDSERTGASTNLRRENFERLPTITRSFTDFSTLTPQAGPGFSFGGRSNLYNNFSIDGSTANNVFGLSALPGGAAGTPVSIDAIDQLNVSLSPYDVSQGSFTGAGVNAVTRSGTNEFQGSVYGFYRNQSFVGRKVEGQEQQQLNFNFYNVGARLGGPIIKNKLFFFVNVEQERRADPAVLFPAGGSDANGRPYQQRTEDLQRLREFLINTGPNKTWTFDPGSFDTFDQLTQNFKFLAKINWNISDQHKLTVRYNQLNAFRDTPPSNSGGFTSAPPGGRQNSNNALPFQYSWYRTNNNLKSVIAELNSTFGNKFANNLQVGYTAFRDFREAGGGAETPNFPTVDILGPNGNTVTSFGPDPFTPNNILNQDVTQINDRFDIFLGKHTVSVGTANEFYKFYNGFTPQIRGVYQYNSIDDFIQNVSNPSAANAPTQYALQYSAVPGTPVPVAEFTAAQLGFYAQDAFNVTKNLRLTAGIRLDIPTYDDSRLLNNAVTDTMRFAGGERIQVSQLPRTNFLWSPRLGFNWDVLGDRSLQVRGGTGIFTGRVPFVWLSNQVSNNGVFFGTVLRQTQANNADFPFRPDPNAYVPRLTGRPGEPLAQTFTINATTRDFRFPQVWRTSLGVDKSLPGGWVLTLDGIYTKDLNAVFIRDANLAAPVGTLTGDGRPIWGNVAGSATVGQPFDRRINDRIVQALVLDNINRGYSLSLTAQVQKRLGRGFDGSLAYTFTDSKDVNAQSASTAGSLYTGQAVVTSPNDPNLSFSNNLIPHRVVGFLQYRLEYLGFLATTFSLTYQGQTAGNFSYVYGGNPNNEGISNNDLIYVPRNQNEILLVTTNAQDRRTTQQIWDQLNAYIEQDPYLSKRRGQYAERNGAYLPWQHQVNFRVLQDIFRNVGGKRNSIQISLDIQNLLNLLNSDWGLAQIATRTNLLNFVGYETPFPSANNAPTTGRPIYSFAEVSAGSALTNSFTNNLTLSSRWQLQVGLRYTFN